MKNPIILIPLFLTLLFVTLSNFGQPLWCSCGQLTIWISDHNSRHTSQHLLDPYSFSHVQHGFVFYFLLYRFFKLERTFSWILTIGIILESLWEMLENTNFIINRYRTGTIALSYFGDSIANSFGDLFCCIFGLYLASRLLWKYSVIICLIIELIMLFAIRDSLSLNVLMLVNPLEAVRNWQSSY